MISPQGDADGLLLTLWRPCARSQTVAQGRWSSCAPGLRWPAAGPDTALASHGRAACRVGKKIQGATPQRNVAPWEKHIRRGAWLENHSLALSAEGLNRRSIGHKPSGCMLKSKTVLVPQTFSEARDDGWVHDARPDKPTRVSTCVSRVIDSLEPVE